MNKYQRYLFVSLIVAVLLSFLLGSSAHTVYADTLRDLFTPTVNRTPPSTPTAGGSFGFEVIDPSNNDCPPGGVQNPNNLIPDPLWLALCGHCMPTATPYSTYAFPTSLPPVCITPVGGGAEVCSTAVPYTFTPTSTSTPFVTPTFTPTVAPVNYEPVTCAVGSLQCEQVNYYTVRYFPSADYQGMDGNFIVSPTVLSLYGFLHVGTYVDASGRSSLFNQQLGGTYPFYGQSVWNGGMGWVYVLPFYHTTEWSQWGTYYQNSVVPGDYYFDFVPDGVGSIITTAGFNQGDSYQLHDYYIVLSSAYYSPDLPVATASPTPTATPSTLSICSVVNGGIGDLGDQDISFWSPSGPPSCLVIPSIASEFIISLAVSALDIIPIIPTGFIEFLYGFVSYFYVVTPPFTICFQPYDFLPIPILGVVFVFQTFADIVLVFFIITHLISK